MSWDAIGAVAELLGSLAVFLTLIYLAVQVRHGRQDFRRSVRQSRAEVSRERLRIRATDQRLNELMVKAEAAFGDDVRSHPFIAALIENAQFSPSDAWAVFMELIAFSNSGTWCHLSQTPPLQEHSCLTTSYSE